jgi:cellobiose phosphorylase
VRENGGLYTHAGVWAIQMECFLKRNGKAWDLFKKISPVDRGMEPRLYVSEPYVTPGNVDGPDSPHFGRGGWTWYTGSAAWLYRIMTEWIIGVRPEWEGLRIDPCVPQDWDEFKIKRHYRGQVYRIRFVRDKNLAKNSVEVRQGDHLLKDGVIPPDPRPSAQKQGALSIDVRFN